MTPEKCDIICPIFHVDLDSFKLFIQTWFQNIPIRRLIIGIGKENHELLYFLLNVQKLFYSHIVVIDQKEHKTLGYCLQELINQVETEYFIFPHADVEIPQNWFEKMWASRVKGIVESLKAPSFGPDSFIQASKKRAYSGAQLILKESVENLNFGDDFIYTNEDIIIQNIVLNRGFSYVKMAIFHHHHRKYRKRTQPRKTILEWQWKGIVKYAYPTSNLMNYIKGILRLLSQDYEIKADLETEIKALNPKWLSLL